MPTPIIIDPITATQTGILRPLYRRALGEQLGGCKVYRATDTASDAEARRHVISTSLRDEESERSRLAGRWLYVTEGVERGHQGRILRSGFYGAGGIAEITPPLGTILESGTEFELSWPLPSEQYLDIKGLNQLVNEALACCLIETRLVTTGNDSRSYSLADQEDYIDQSDRVDAIYDQFALSSTEPSAVAPYPIRVDTDGIDRTLVTGYLYGTDQTFSVRVLRRGHTLINDGTGWATSTVGLTADYESAVVPIPWVVAFGMVKALQHTAKLVREDRALDRAERNDRLNEMTIERRRWAQAAVLIAQNEFPRPTQPSGQSLTRLMSDWGSSEYPLERL